MPDSTFSNHAPLPMPRSLSDEIRLLDAALRQPDVHAILAACRALVALFDDLSVGARPCLDDQLALMNAVELAAVNCTSITRHSSSLPAIKAAPEELTELEFALCWVMMAADTAVQLWGPGLPSVRMTALQFYVEGDLSTTLSSADALLDLPTPSASSASSSACPSPSASFPAQIHAPSPKYPISPRNIILPPTPSPAPTPALSPPPAVASQSAYVPQSTSLGLIFPRGFETDRFALRTPTSTSTPTDAHATPTKRLPRPSRFSAPPTPPPSSSESEPQSESESESESDAEREDGPVTPPRRTRKRIAGAAHTLPLQCLGSLRHARARMLSNASPSPPALAKRDSGAGETETDTEKENTPVETRAPPSLSTACDEETETEKCYVRALRFGCEKQTAPGTVPPRDEQVERLAALLGRAVHVAGEAPVKAAPAPRPRGGEARGHDR